MSDSDYSKNGLFGFLKESAITGVLNPAIARSRKTAAEQLLNHVTGEERMNLRLLDVDELCSRIHKLEDSSIRIEALNLYNARLKSALLDYFCWLDDPANFSSTSSPAIKSGKAQIKRHSEEQKALESITLSRGSEHDEIIPIPLRKDLVVYIKDLPLDLSKNEAAKIARVIQAYVEDDTL